MLDALRYISDPNTDQKSALEVVAGLHAGVTLILDPNDYTIGSTPDANIVLRDAGVQPLHASLRIGHGSARVQAVGGDVRLANGELVPKGYGAKLKLPVTLGFGEAQVRLSWNGNPNRLGAFFEPITRIPAVEAVANVVAERPMLLAAGALSCVLAISFAAGGLPNTSLNVTAPAPVNIPPPAKVAALPRMKTGVPLTAADINVAAEQLAEHLKSAGLTSLKVTTNDRRVVATGSLSTREAPAWTDAQRWFDDTYGGRIVLTATIAIGEARNMPTAVRLQAIYFGDRPYVITEDGLRFFPGAFLNNGWIIQEISENRVLLAKDGETLALTYR